MTVWLITLLDVGSFDIFFVPRQITRQVWRWGAVFCQLTQGDNTKPQKNGGWLLIYIKFYGDLSNS